MVILIVCVAFYAGAYVFFRLRKHPRSVAFFHPNCAAMGGGERVLWSLVKTMLGRGGSSKASTIDVLSVYYDSRGPPPETFLKTVHDQFNIPVKTALSEQHGVPSLRFVPIRTAFLLQPELYPRFTLLLQALASMVVACEALLRWTPAVFVDTTGFTLTTFVAKCASGCAVSAYIHYPMVLKTMTRPEGTPSAFKRWYYRLFACLYRLAGSLCTTCVVNSSWTYAHMKALMVVTSHSCEQQQQRPNPVVCWLTHATSLTPDQLSIVYPPCDLRHLQMKAKPWNARRNVVVSVAQFRPEKNHVLQLQAISEVVRHYKAVVPSDLHFMICGSLRGPADQALLDHLHREADRLHVSDYVTFNVNVPYGELQDLLASSKVGLHTMVDEHFGIAVVEFLAAGMVVIAHNSAGPAFDILNSARSNLTLDDIAERKRQAFEATTYTAADFGFLASTASGFAKAIVASLSTETAALRARATTSLNRFLDTDQFGERCLQAMRLEDLCVS